VRRVTAAQVALSAETHRMTTAEGRSRVARARTAARERLSGTPWRLNSQVPGPWLRGPAALGGRTTAAIDRALERGGLTMRGYDRVLRLSWTVADLDGAERPGVEHVGRALYLRRAMS
jgi:magnesium chelatase family protein